MTKLNIDIDENTLLGMLSELVALDSSFPPGSSYPEMATLLERMTASLGGTHSRVEVPETLWKVPGTHGLRTNLIVRPDLAPEGSPEVTIYFHVDTAPVGDGWNRPAFQMTCEDNRVYARGAADMKGAIAAALAGLEALRSAGHTFAFQPVLAFCTDEEGGVYPGIRYLAEQNLVSDIIINLNGSATPRIWAGSFGSLDLSFEFEGKAAHSGRPELGINAIEQALPVLHALTTLKTQVETRTSAMPPPPTATEPLHALLNITAIHGGDKGSALPGTCRVVINRRYAPEENVVTVRSEIQTCVEAAAKNSDLVGWTVSEIGHLPPVENTQGVMSPRWTAAMSAGYEVPLDEFVAFGSTTSSDFGWIQKAGGRHREIMLGGLSRPDRNVHAADEFTTKEDLLGLARSIALFFSADFD
ncbi:acetylornithine deacetylase [Marinomonas ushuaiensis DSM 15871]|uniref:Acetylornithine deacetylase n=2 Tax=Marinomonas TaxID=28253 RepID=X7E880_9GAMM|nr:acetylornithine deacetylase [Marinomonas ushuaiensis DSM 15871]